MKAIDLTGELFDRCIATDVVTRGRYRYWICQCVCGRFFDALGESLRNGNTRSCGCQPRKKQLSVAHRIWCQIYGACYLPGSRRYKDYGLRGANMAHSWKYSPEAFEKWYRMSLMSFRGADPTLIRLGPSQEFSETNCILVEWRRVPNSTTGGFRV